MAGDTGGTIVVSGAVVGVVTAISRTGVGSVAFGLAGTYRVGGR